MYLRILAFSSACVTSVCQSAEPIGQQRGEALVRAAQQHLGVRDSTRTVGLRIGAAREHFREVRYDRPGHNRFATYVLDEQGKLREFVVNQPDGVPYKPIENRPAFIAGLMEIVAPASSKDERIWAGRQLDSLWTKVTHPRPVQVGDYVFNGLTGGFRGFHDTLWIVAAGTGASGLRYRAPYSTGNARIDGFVTSLQRRDEQSLRTQIAKFDTISGRYPQFKTAEEYVHWIDGCRIVRVAQKGYDAADRTVTIDPSLTHGAAAVRILEPIYWIDWDCPGGKFRQALNPEFRAPGIMVSEMMTPEQEPNPPKGVLRR